ncbi:hypothetical protein AB5L52_42765 [Streptomyces sp. CG4]
MLLRQPEYLVALARERHFARATAAGSALIGTGAHFYSVTQ